MVMMIMMCDDDDYYDNDDVIMMMININSCLNVDSNHARCHNNSTILV